MESDSEGDGTEDEGMESDDDEGIGEVRARLTTSS